jgi:hypothetical protein
LSYLEAQFEQLWLYYYPQIDLHKEYRFAPPRRFRWDFCHLESKIAIEINGKIWGKGGHSSGKGLLSDYAKICLASSQGWRVFILAEPMITIEYLTLIANTIKAN